MSSSGVYGFTALIVGMAIGALLGGLGQLAIQIPALRSHGYRWTAVVSFRDPDVLRMVAEHGHTVAIHGVTHKKVHRDSEASVEREISTATFNSTPHSLARCGATRR